LADDVLGWWEDVREGKAHNRVTVGEYRAIRCSEIAPTKSGAL
jgi:hypothetical protein